MSGGMSPMFGENSALLGSMQGSAGNSAGVGYTNPRDSVGSPYTRHKQQLRFCKALWHSRAALHKVTTLVYLAYKACLTCRKEALLIKQVGYNN
jgi:hypothetical protein